MNYDPIIVSNHETYAYAPERQDRACSDPLIFSLCKTAYSNILKKRDVHTQYEKIEESELRREREKALALIEDVNIYGVFEMLLRELDRCIRIETGPTSHVYAGSEFPVLDAGSGSRVIPAAGTLQYAGLSIIRVIPMGAIEDMIRSDEECTLATVAMSYLKDAEMSSTFVRSLGIEYLLFKDFLVLSPIYASHECVCADRDFDTKRIWIIASDNICMIPKDITLQDGFLSMQYTHCNNLTQVLKVPFEDYNTEINFSNPLILGTLTRDAILGAVNMRDFSGYEITGISRLLNGDETSYVAAIEEIYRFCSLEQFITDLYEAAFLLLLWDKYWDSQESRVLKMSDYPYRSDKYLYIRNLLKLLDKAVCIRLKQQVLEGLKNPDTYYSEDTMSYPLKNLRWAIRYLNKYARPVYDMSIPAATCAEVCGKVPGLDREGLTVLGVPPMFPTYEGMPEEDRRFLEDYTGNSPRWAIRQRASAPSHHAYKKTSLDLGRYTNLFPIVLDMGRDGKIAVLPTRLFPDVTEGSLMSPGLRILWCSNANYSSIYENTPGAASGIVRDADTVVSTLKKLKPVRLEHLVNKFVRALESGKIGTSVMGRKYENQQTGLLLGSSRCSSLLRVMPTLNFPLWYDPSNELFARIFKSTFMLRSSGSNGLEGTGVADDPGLAWGIYILRGILEKEITQVQKAIEEDARTWDIADRYYAKNRR